ncbi:MULTISPECIES: hypothetical protein [unclassified Streptococcus]|uniref:hypothetical protein n=1 Tax=unclassified Streptococcus TaxID=2608887 RepID=UPI0010715DCC|nr:MULTISPECIES: hypothetical protein [unclassified Streptococcus]MBF0786842.1 hypothetical protein [Streptococcus sp. 19428wC2_LYSM12]MCQ9212749.1 hypothetical protein [Streptococcus sp. B01]MCQ9214090.1 hypothetical protein [Streptococcus sp. O1]TFV06213.1 hypothetical protein E4T79_02780 [Streptococcus sp. LYSM12]
MTKLQDYANEIMSILNTNYSKQLKFSGIIKDIHELMTRVLEKDGDVVLDVPSLVRCFVDATMDFESPIITYLEKIEEEIKKGKH